MAISTLGAVFTAPLVKLPTVSEHKDSLRYHDSGVGSLGRQSVSFLLRRPGFPLRMVQSKSLVWKSVPNVGRGQRQPSFLMRVSASLSPSGLRIKAAQTVKERAQTTVVAPIYKKIPSLDSGGTGNGPYDMDGTGGRGRGGWGGWGGGGGGGNWGPSGGGLILFGIILFLSYLKDLEKANDDEEGDYYTE
ncbi:hypothetical protein Cgig2_008294 [Carnegiea gigantea]|uniref:Uncharacterized protein n=1 Tax=Carnegiea gigantea TaxID=171969 RepID=A0A9Q1GYZ2_9CARY|nr:hypothetical protein Cgig2_008294 [Carnegiea gigantea]